MPYTFTVTNTGNVTLTGVDGQPTRSARRVISARPGDTNSDAQAPDDRDVDLQLRTHTVTQAEIDAGGNLSNTVTVDSAESGPDTDTRRTSRSAQTPALTVDKSSTTTVGDGRRASRCRTPSRSRTPATMTLTNVTVS